MDEFSRKPATPLTPWSQRISTHRCSNMRPAVCGSGRAGRNSTARLLKEPARSETRGWLSLRSEKADRETADERQLALSQAVKVARYRDGASVHHSHIQLQYLTGLRLSPPRHA